MSDRSTRKYIRKYAKHIANKYGVDPNLLAYAMYGIVSVESDFDEDAKNKNSTARGLTQILIKTQRYIEKELAKIKHAPAIYKTDKFPDAPTTTDETEDKMFFPEYAIRLGLHYLAYQFKRYGAINKAVYAYHIGSYSEKNINQDGLDYLEKVIKEAKPVLTKVWA